MPRPVTQFVERGSVEMRRALKGFEARQANEIIAGPVIGFAEPLADADAAAPQETINGRVALIGIAYLHLAQRQNPIGQAFALIDVENGVFAHHGDDARFAFLAVLVGDLELLHKIDLGAVLAFAHVAAQLQSLLERT